MFELRRSLLALLVPAALLGCTFPAGDEAGDESVDSTDEAIVVRPSAVHALRAKSLPIRLQLPDHAASVTVDHAGNLILAGRFEGTLDLGGGPMTSAGDLDLFVAKLDRDGHLLWSRRFGGADRQAATSVAVDRSDNILVAGVTQGDVDFGAGPITEPGLVLAKLDPSGAAIWSKGFAGSGTIGQVRADASGNVILRGSFSGPIDLGGGALDDGGGASSTFVAKLDGGGQHVWSKGYGDKDLQAALGMDVDSTGDVVVVGRMAESFDFGGGTITSAGDLDAFVVKYGPSGEHRWSENYGDADIQVATAVTVDGNDAIVLTGYNYGSIDLGGGALVNSGPRDMFLAKLAASGEHAWSQSFDGGDTDLIASDAAGNILLAGSFRNTIHIGKTALTSAGDTDVYLAKFGPGGKLASAKRYGGADTQYTESLAADASGRAILAGAFAGSIDLGGGPMTSPSGQSGFVVRIAP